MGRIDVENAYGSVSFGSLWAWDYIVGLVFLQGGAAPEPVKVVGEDAQWQYTYDAATSKRISESIIAALPDIPSERCVEPPCSAMPDFPIDTQAGRAADIFSYWSGQREKLQSIADLFATGQTIVFFDC